MKKIVYSLLAFIILSVSSCEKVLDKKPLDFNTELVSYYDTPEKLDGNLRGVYDALQAGALYGTLMHYRLGLEADEGYYARESPTSGPQSFEFTSGHSDIYGFWRDLYKGIGRANNFLANVNSNTSIDEAYRNKLRGEALFLRGYFYFMLVKHFGGVPLILTPLKADNVEDIDIPRATAKEVYEQILVDMKEAEPLVDGIEKIGHGGRISKSAVRGMLARVCLHMAGYPVRDLTKYQEAKDWAYKVISDAAAGHDLNPSFSQIFINYAQDKYDPKESIWEIEFKGNGQDAFTEVGQVGYVNGPSTSSDVIGQGFGGVRVTSKLYNIYKLGDLRRDWTIAPFTYSGTNYSYTTAVSTASLFSRQAAKFRREYETLKPKHRTRTPQNFPLLRYSDVLLMYAEADYEVVNKGTGNGAPSAEAISYIEKVRYRGMSKGGIRAFVFGKNDGGYTPGEAVTITLVPPAGGTTASMSVAVTASGANAGKLATPTVNRDPVTGFKMGSGYTSYTRVVLSPVKNGTYATIRTYDPIDALTVAEKGDFRKTIQDERMREFAFELIRKGDLTRWGEDTFEFEMRQVANTLRTAGVTTTYYYYAFSNVRKKHSLWPIPAREVNLNRKIVQNPGW